MKLLRDTKFDFMKYRRFWLAFSALVMALGVVAVFFLGRLNLGIDFVGGTQLTLKFRQRPDVQQLRDVVAAARASSGLSPQLEIVGPLDSAVPDAVRPHLVAVLVEAISNAVRHSGASTITARVEVGDGHVSLQVVDDGHGFVPTGRESGVRNIRSRATAVAGGSVIDSVVGSGTVVRWWAPLAGGGS